MQDKSFYCTCIIQELVYCEIVNGYRGFGNDHFGLHTFDHPTMCWKEYLWRYEVMMIDVSSKNSIGLKFLDILTQERLFKCLNFGLSNGKNIFIS